MGKRSTLSGGFSTQSVDLPPGKIPAFLEASACNDSGVVLLLVALENGEVLVFSEDLSRAVANLDSESGRECQYATSISLMQARKGFLKKREDLLARVEATSSARLWILFERKTAGGDTKTNPETSSLLVKIVAILGRNSSRALNSALDCEVVGSFRIDIPILSNVTAEYYLQVSGQLLVWTKDQVVQFQLGGLSVAGETTIKFEQNISSLTRLSTKLIAVVDNGSIKVIDIEHISISSMCLLPPAKMSYDGRNAQQTGDQTGKLLAFFPSLGILLFLRGRALSSFSFSETDPKRYHHRTLADAIGRGLNASHKSPRSPEKAMEILGMTYEGESHTKRRTLSAINKAADSMSAEGLDNEFASILPAIAGSSKSSKDSFGTHFSPLQLAQNRQLISHLLSKIFALRTSQHDQNSTKLLEVRLMPPLTFQWLVLCNLMTVHRIELALRQTGHLLATADLHPCALVQALAAYDQSSTDPPQAMMFLLASPTPLAVREIACGTRYALDILQQSENLANLKLITGTEMAIDYSSNSRSNAEERDHASPEPEKDADKIHDAQSVMRVCLSRLTLCHGSDVRDALGQELSASQLLSLVNHLRAELAGSGWLSSYVQDTAPSEEFIQEDNQINLIAKILCCAVDALGAGAWLNATVSDEDAEKISWMKAETSAALEGIEEATYLQGLLHEALLFAKRAPPPPSTTKPALVDSDSIEHVRPVKILSEETESNALPLGLRPRDHVETKVIKHGKEEQRTKREIGRLKSKMVGAYSIERIMI